MICKASSKEPIFRFKTCGLSAIFLFVLYMGIPLVPYMKPFFSLFIRFLERIQDFEFGVDMAVFYDTSINLLVTSVSTITIMSSFLNHRYLGANYKFWMFKNSPYFLTPQEDILLMVVNLVGYLPYMLCKKYGMLSFVSYLVSWWLFLYLMYQVYVYVIKVSHMFHKVSSRMIRKNKNGKWDEICDEIYKKLAAIRYVDSHNSYFSEEIDSSINGFALGVALFSVAMLIWYMELFHNKTIEAIFTIILMIFGIGGTFLEIEKAKEIKGMTDLSMGIIITCFL